MLCGGDSSVALGQTWHQRHYLEAVRAIRPSLRRQECLDVCVCVQVDLNKKAVNYGEAEQQVTSCCLCESCEPTPSLVCV